MSHIPPPTDAPRRGVPNAGPDVLPPVEPPSAAFLVQLFVVPAIIVSIIVFVWLAFHWLAQLGNDPEAYVRTLRRANEGRWQAALNLANDLRGPGGGVLKSDTRLAGELASILRDEMGSGRPRGGGHTGEQSRTLCGYLCRALGEFAVPEAADPLIERARDDDDPQTARTAVEALAVLSANLAAAGRSFDDPAAVRSAVLQTASADDQGLRSAAAYTLGVLGGDASIERLEGLLEDAAEEVRYNAAVGLARQGSDASWDTLSEMLALPDPPAAKGDEAAQATRYRRVLIVVNALKAIGLLMDESAQAPPDGVATLVASLGQDPVGDVRAAANAVAGKISRLSSRPPAPAGG